MQDRGDFKSALKPVFQKKLILDGCEQITFGQADGLQLNK